MRIRFQFVENLCEPFFGNPLSSISNPATNGLLTSGRTDCDFSVRRIFDGIRQQILEYLHDQYGIGKYRAVMWYVIPDSNSLWLDQRLKIANQRFHRWP